MNTELSLHLLETHNINLHNLIGIGLTSQVFLASREGQQCAVKVYEVEKEKTNRIVLQYEIETCFLQLFKNVPGIVQIECFGMFEKYAYVVMELLPLCLRDICLKFDEIKAKIRPQLENKKEITENALRKGETMLEKISEITKNFMAQQVKILEFLEMNGIIHRDIKLENLLIDKLSNIKLIDFGAIQLTTPLNAKSEKNIEKESEKEIKDQSKEHHEENEESEEWKKIKELNYKLNFKNDILTGSKHYIAPEIVAGKRYRIISTKIDIWAFGIMFYRILCGNFPFEVTDINKTSELFSQIREKSVKYPTFLSKEEIEVLEACLQKDPEKRANAKQLLELSYFNKVDWKNIYNSKVIHSLFSNNVNSSKKEIEKEKENAEGKDCENDNSSEEIVLKIENINLHKHISKLESNICGEKNNIEEGTPDIMLSLSPILNKEHEKEEIKTEKDEKEKENGKSHEKNRRFPHSELLIVRKKEKVLLKILHRNPHTEVFHAILNEDICNLKISYVCKNRIQIKKELNKSEEIMKNNEKSVENEEKSIENKIFDEEFKNLEQICKMYEISHPIYDIVFENAEICDEFICALQKNSDKNFKNIKNGQEFNENDQKQEKNKENEE